VEILCFSTTGSAVLCGQNFITEQYHRAVVIKTVACPISYTDNALVKQDQCSILKYSLPTDMTHNKMVIIQRTGNVQPCTYRSVSENIHAT